MNKKQINTKDKQYNNGNNNKKWNTQLTYSTAVIWSDIDNNTSATVTS